MNRLTTAGRLLLTGTIIALLWGVKWLIMDSGYVIKRTYEASKFVQTVDLPDAPKNAASAVEALPLPGEEPALSTQKSVNMEVWAWNAQMGLMLANGGKETTKGSLMEKAGVRLVLKREDNSDQMKADLIRFARAYAKDPNSTEGTHYVLIMGDGYRGFLEGLRTELLAIGPQYGPKVIGSAGRSLGEDGFWGPQSWKDNPAACKGGVISCYVKDGDWNIVMKWAGDNGLKEKGVAINVNPKTYDPDALNFIYAADYVDAGQKMITGYSEERTVVINGKPTGEKKTIKADGYASWTPVDVEVAQNLGGLVRLASTKEYRAQMPCIIIGIDQYMQDHRPQVEAMLNAICQGGDQVKSFSTALDKAGAISAKVYNQNDGAYWVRYYKGISEADKKGNVVELGGSRVNNLGDNLNYFGLSEGSTDVYKSVYEVFGDLLESFFPKDYPGKIAYQDVVDYSYLRALMGKTNETERGAADEVTFTADEGVRQKVSEKAWNIVFGSGKATLTASGIAQLEDLHKQLQIAQGLKVEIHGHTDNVGSPQGNPFSHKSHSTAAVLCASRGEAVLRHRQTLLYTPRLLDELPSLSGEIIGCWCSPQPCHGHTLAEWSDFLAGFSQSEQNKLPQPPSS